MDANTAAGQTSERPRHSVSVAGVIFDAENRCLLLKRCDTGEWQLPGGVLELGETIPEGLIREVREETGLAVEPGPLTGVYKNMKAGVVALVFRCTATGGELRPNEEASAFRWMTEYEIRSEVVEAFAIRLLDGLSGTQPAIRAHDGTHLL